jgi:NAD+ synthase (glutamine-hydrolysing)
MRLALAQINPTVGDVPGNEALAREAIERARGGGADVVILPELCLLGYPPRDLLFREGVIEACEGAAERLARDTRGIAALIPHPRRSAPGSRKSAHNSVTIARDGRAIGAYDKRLLPGYDVFDEDRYFEPGTQPFTFDYAGVRLGVLICEDLWRAHDVAGGERLVPSIADDPVAHTASLGCKAILVPSASPFVLGKGARHAAHLSALAKKHGVTIALVNQVGANDDLIFDGRSMLVTSGDGVIAAAKPFESDLLAIDLDDRSPRGNVSIDGDAMAELWRALVLGVRDYVRKTGYRGAIVGLSGGIDSALTATIATAALGAANVHGVLMPSRYSSPGSITDAEALARSLKLGRVETVSMESVHAAFESLLAKPLGEQARGLTDENVQARLRGVILMAASNAAGSLVLATGNKSEMATGYTTLYGDMCGALAVLGDVYKTQVWDLSRWVNANHRAAGFDAPPIPRASIDKVPSAELRPNQTDQDTLPPYPVLDEIIRRFVDFEQHPDRIARETGCEAAMVERWCRVIDRNEYKRMQAAIVLKVSPRAFGPGRPMPAAMKSAF